MPKWLNQRRNQFHSWGFPQASHSGRVCAIRSTVSFTFSWDSPRSGCQAGFKPSSTEDVAAKYGCCRVPFLFLLYLSAAGKFAIVFQTMLEVGTHKCLRVKGMKGLKKVVSPYLFSFMCTAGAWNNVEFVQQNNS